MKQMDEADHFQDNFCRMDSLQILSSAGHLRKAYEERVLLLNAHVFDAENCMVLKFPWIEPF